jgi:Tol biopolymer transport system component
MKKIYYSLGFLSLIILSSCSVTQYVDYGAISVPEEGGMKFVKYTEEHEKVYGPVIQTSETGQLVWYAAPLIALSPDGEKIAYIAEGNEFKNLYIKNVSGGKSVVQRTFNRNINDMSYSPNGESISFTSVKGNVQNVYLINANEGAAVQQIVATTANELGPSFSPDGKTLFFTKQERGRYYIWSVDLETALQTQYSEGFTPVMDPTGKYLIVTRNSKDGSRGEIWTIDIKKGTETLIMSDPIKGFSSPAISPDGKSIVCVSNTEKETNKPQNLDLYVFNINGTGLKQITFHAGNDVSPQWSPDGKSVFFISQRGNEKGKFNLWKTNITK